MKVLASGALTRKWQNALGAFFIVTFLLCSWLVVNSSNSRAQAAPACTIPTKDIALSATNQSTSGPTRAWDTFLVKAIFNRLDGLPQGCSATVGLPKEFSGLHARTVYINADGTSTSAKKNDSILQLTVDPTSRSIIYTTTAYTETHRNIKVIGYVMATVDDTIVRGSKKSLNFSVNGQVQPTVIDVEPCQGPCPAAPTRDSKWGQDSGDGTGTVTIETQVYPVGSHVEVSDILNSPNQQPLGLGWVAAYNCVTEWGAAGVKQSNGTCQQGAGLPLEYTYENGVLKYVVTRPNEFVRLNVNMAYSGEGPWSDTARITVDGVTRTTSATVTAYAVGGNGSGEDPQVPSTSLPPTAPAPSPTSTVPTTPSPTTGAPSSSTSAPTSPTSTSAPTTSEPTSTPSTSSTASSTTAPQPTGESTTETPGDPTPRSTTADPTASTSEPTGPVVETDHVRPGHPGLLYGLLGMVVNGAGLLVLVIARVRE